MNITFKTLNTKVKIQHKTTALYDILQQLIIPGIIALGYNKNALINVMAQIVREHREERSN